MVQNHRLSRQGTWRTYTTRDGLAGLQVEHIVEDRDGFLWFATLNGGVSRFDGDEFRTFTSRDGLCSNQILAMLEDRQGRLWFGSEDSGICWYSNGDFGRLAPKGDKIAGPVSFLCEDAQGRLWIAGKGVIGYCQGTTFHSLYPLWIRDLGASVQEDCWGIAQDQAGQLWFGYERLVRYDGHAFQSFGPEHGLPEYSATYGLDQPPKGGPLWIGGREIGRFDGQTYQGAVCVWDTVRKIQHDRQGRAWFLTTGSGILCFDGFQFHHITPQEGLAYHMVNAMLEDRQGHLWFATWGKGVSRYDPNTYIFTAQNGLPGDEVTVLEEDGQDRIWMGFGRLGMETTWNFEVNPNDKVAVYHGASIAVLGPEQGIDIQECLSLREDGRGYLWIGAWDGLVRGDGSTFRRIKTQQGHSGIQVHAMAPGSGGDLLLGYLEGQQWRLSRWDGQHFNGLLDLGQQWNYEVSRYYISALLQRRNGSIWFGLTSVHSLGEGAGVGCFVPGQAPTYYTEEEGLAHNHIEDLLEDRQENLWIATVGGLSRFDGKTFENFTMEHGLPNNHIQALLEDRQGRLWAGTESGVARFDGQRRFHTVCSEHLGSTYAIVEARDGRFWFGTQDGLVGYKPTGCTPRIRITQVTADQVYKRIEALEIFASTPQVVFEYKGMSSHPRDILYSCRLEGWEEEWGPATPSRRAYYHGLPPGEYTFKVRAIDQDANYSAEPATVALRVVPDPLVEELTQALGTGRPQRPFVGHSEALRQVQAHLHEIAPTDLTVLILGETGTGKGLAAAAVHGLSSRKTGPFIPVNCGAIAAGLVESELFGHEKGAFTGALARKLGKVEIAQTGTLFLDEIGDMPLEAQVKLLRFLEEKQFERVGGTQTLAANVRIIAATNRDLRQMIAAGRFRQDLYFRLQSFPVHLPPLRKRREDIPLLARFFAEAFARHLNRPIPQLSEAALMHLQGYDWPGNVRELEHLIQRAVLRCKSGWILAQDVAVGGGRAKGTANPLADGGDDFIPLAQMEKQYIEKALAATNGVVSGPKGAAQLLGINAETLRSRIRKHGIRRPS